MNSALGIQVPGPYFIDAMDESPAAPWPQDYALSAPPGGPFYQLAPLERPQPFNSFNAAILLEWRAWKLADRLGLPGSGKQPQGSGGSGSGSGSGYGGSGSGYGGSGYGGSGSATGGSGNSIFTAYATNPVDTMPDTGQPLHYTGSIATPAPGSTDTTVLEVIVPDGWIAVIKAVSNDYANNSFQEGAGDLIWRISIDGLFPPGFENIKTRLGSIAQPLNLPGAIIAIGGQTVKYTVSVDAAATIPTGSTVYTHCSLDGYLVPAL